MPVIDVPKPRENKGFAAQTEQVIYWTERNTRPLTASSLSFTIPLKNAYLQSEVKCYNTNTYLKVSEINNAWETEYTKYQNYIKGDLDFFYKDVRLINQVVAKINYEDFAIELTPSSTIKYSLLLPDKKLLMITKSFENYEDKAENDVVFSIFDNKNLILSDIKDLYELVSGINRYIEM